MKDFSTFWAKQLSTAVRVKRASSSQTTAAPSLATSDTSVKTQQTQQTDIETSLQGIALIVVIY